MGVGCARSGGSPITGAPRRRPLPPLRHPEEDGRPRAISAPKPRARARAALGLRHDPRDASSPSPRRTGSCEAARSLTNASPHVGKRVVMNLDLERLLPDAVFRRVKGALREARLRGASRDGARAAVHRAAARRRRARRQGAPRRARRADAPAGRVHEPRDHERRLPHPRPPPRGPREAPRLHVHALRGRSRRSRATTSAPSAGCSAARGRSSPQRASPSTRARRA